MFITPRYSVPTIFRPRINRRRPLCLTLLARLIMVLTRSKPKTLAEVRPVRGTL